MRVGVVDIGTNSTRLLVGDVAGGAVEEVRRETAVTRLGQGVDASGRLAEEAMERVYATLERYAEAIAEAGCERTTAVLTSAVRDAANGPEFTAAVAERYGLDANTIGGEREAALMFAGVLSGRGGRDGGPLLVIDIGGGSTEFVIGTGAEVDFRVSTRAGVVRQTERRLAHDPPQTAELEALRDEVAGIIAAEVPAQRRAGVTDAVAVAGTATSCAAIEQGLEPYDPERVHGFRLTRAALSAQLERLAAVTVAERREVAGLHPDRAPTIVAGVVILIAALDAFGLDSVEISERDILHGAALACARDSGPSAH